MHASRMMHTGAAVLRASSSSVATVRSRHVALCASRWAALQPAAYPAPAQTRAMSAAAGIAQGSTNAAPIANASATAGSASPAPSSPSTLLNAGLASFARPAEMYTHIRSLTSKYDVVRNYVGVVRDMSAKSLCVETDLFPKDALEFYSKYNLLLLRPESNPRDRELHDKFYTPARGGGQGDYRLGIQEKVANVVSALRAFPQSKRAVLPVPHSAKPSVTADHTDTDEAKCLRELHFYIEADDKGQKVLCCTGFMRAQAASIFPKNVHFIGTVMAHVAGELQLPVGSYTHIVTTLVDER